MCEVTFQANANKDFFECNNLCLGLSKKDDTPSILHGTLSHTFTHYAFEFILKSSYTPLYTKGDEYFVEIVVISPEQDHELKKRKMHAVILPQKRTAT